MDLQISTILDFAQKVVKNFTKLHKITNNERKNTKKIEMVTAIYPASTKKPSLNRFIGFNSTQFRINGAD
jgi:hypothetical protein